MSLEHAVHEAILSFRFVALAAHKGTSAVIATSTGALEVLTADIIDKTSTNFTHAVSCDACHISNWQSISFAFN
jgi:predicted nicotinamide N-methyase